MEYIKLQNGLTVAPAVLGAMNFGTTTSKEAAYDVLDAYVEMGGNFIDTSNNYAHWAGTGDEYNKANGIVPQTIVKGVRDVIEIGTSDEAKAKKGKRGAKPEAPKKLTKADREAMIEQLTAEMKRAAKQLDFERAAMLRDKIKILRDEV